MSTCRCCKSPIEHGASVCPSCHKEQNVLWAFARFSGGLVGFAAVAGLLLQVTLAVLESNRTKREALELEKKAYYHKFEAEPSLQVVSFNSVRVKEATLDPVELAGKRLTHEELMHAHFSHLLRTGWSPEREVILLIAGTTAKGTNGRPLSCEGNQFEDFLQYHFSGIVSEAKGRLEALEKEILAMVRTESPVKTSEIKPGVPAGD